MLTVVKLTPDMSSMVGPRSMLRTGACKGQTQTLQQQNQLLKKCKQKHVLDCSDLQSLVRFDAWTSDQEWDPDVELVQLPLINGE